MLQEMHPSEFPAVYAIMSQSFPGPELRTYEGQEALLARPDYRIRVCREATVIQGFVAYY